MSRTVGNFNFPANLEVLAKAPLDAKQLVGTYDDLINPNTWNGSGSVWLYDGAFVVVGKDPDPLKRGLYWLCDADNFTNPNSWVKSGSGAITGGTNGLAVFNDTNIGLGGNLIQSTVIDGTNNDLSIINVNLLISSSGVTSNNIVLDNSGITLSRDSISVNLDNGSGLVYGGDYRNNFNNFSLVDLGYVTGVTSTKLSISDFNTYSGITVPNTFLKLDQSTPQTISSGQPLFSEGIILGDNPLESSVSGHCRGRIYYDSEYQTIATDVNDNVTIQLGQETVRYVYNAGTTLIPNGTPVYMTGVHIGNVGKPDVISIGLAIADNSEKSEVVGVTTEDIGVNEYGYVTVRGAINGLNTLTASPYSGMTAGDIIYLSADVYGGVTNIPPTTPNVEIELGRLIRKDSATGNIYVNVNPSYSLNKLIDVTVPSPNVDDVLKFNGSEWVNGSVGAISAGAGVVYYNSTPILFTPTNTPFGISSTGLGNGVQIGSLSKIPITTPVDGYVVIGNANNDTRFFSAWVDQNPLGRTKIDAGTWKSTARIAVDSVGGGSLTCAGRNFYQVVSLSGDTVNVTGTGINARTVTLNSGTGQFIGSYFTGTTVNTNASWLQICQGTSMGIYQICQKISDNSVCIVVPSTFVNSSGNTGAVWNKLFGGVSDAITSVLPTYHICEVSMSLPEFTVNPTDKLGQMGYVVSNANRQLYMTYNGEMTASYFQTPLVTSHNDLSGLQGGTGTQRYHVDADKYSVIQNTTGVNTGDETKETIETKLTGEIVTHYHPYSGLTGRPDLNLYQTVSGFTAYTNSVSGVISNAVTGVTTSSVTGVTIYDGIADNQLILNNIIGSGYTSVSKVGNDVIVYSSGATGSEYVFDYDIVVSISEGKTFGKYQNGDTIPSSGKTAVDVIKLALSEALPPTLTLSSSGNNVVFGEANKVVKLSFSYIINTLNAAVDTAVIEWRRGDTGSWVLLTDTILTPSSYTHNIDDSSNRFNSLVINYRYTVTDTAGAVTQITHNVTPQIYAQPTFNISLNGTIVSPETQNIREKGNVISSPSGSISSNRGLVDITAWSLERRYNGGIWQTLASGSGLEVQNVSIPSTLDGLIPTSVSLIEYRISYVDEYTNGSGGNQSITFKYYSYWGFNTNTIVGESQIEAFSAKNFMSSQALNWNNVNTPVGNYTYYAYPSTYSDVVSIVKNGILQDFDAWQKLSNVNVTNSYGESLNYKVWRTNATSVYNSTDDIVIT